MKHIVALLLCVSVWIATADAAQTFFSANAEDGLACIGNAQTNCKCEGRVTNVTSPVQQGSRSYKMLDTAPRSDNGAKCYTFLGAPDYTVGTGEAFYSAWYNLETGWLDNQWKNNLQWKGVNFTGCCPGMACDGKVKASIGFQNFSGVRNIVLNLRHWVREGASKPSLTAISPTLGSGYIDTKASDPNYYTLRLASPPAIPKNQWFRIEVWMKQTPTNGAVKLWYTNPSGTTTLLYDIAHPDIDAVTVWCDEPTNTIRSLHKRAYMLWNSYNSMEAGADPETTLFSDDIRITDFQVSQASGGDTTPPNAPTGLTLTTPYPGHFQVTWNAPTGTGEQIDFATYNLERCQGNGCSNFLPVSGYNGTATTFLDTGLVRTMEYTYRVQACDDEGSPLCGAYDTEIGNTTAGALVALYTLDEGTGTTANDTGPSAARDGTICNGATCPHAGTVLWDTSTHRIGTGALTLDGTDDFIKVADHASLDFTASQDFTVAMWVKSSEAAQAGDFPIFAVKQNGDTVGVSDGWQMGLHDALNDPDPVLNRWYGAVVVDGTYYKRYGCTDIADGTWHHVTMTRQGQELRVYEDGGICGTALSNAAIDNTLDAGAETLNFGIYHDETSDPLNGSLDDIRIYNYALSATEISALAAPAAAIAMTAWRLHGVDSLLGKWKASTNKPGHLRKNGSIAWRFQIHNDSAANISTPIALQCKIGVAGSYALAPEYLVDQEGGIDATCLSRQFCVQADQVLADGTDNTATPLLPLPAGTTNADYVTGTLVTSAAWPTVSLAPNELTEVQFRTAAVEIADGSTLCCRPSKGDDSALDEYNVGTIGEACVVTNNGIAGLW